MPENPIAYFLTWTCYGTWLHGIDKLAVDRHRTGHKLPRLKADPARVEHAQRLMKFAPVVLAPDACKSVDQAIRQTADKRCWPLHALNVRTNHVHVVAMCDGAPERMLNDFKAYATRRLRADKVIAPDQPVWTDGGSTRYRGIRFTFGARCTTSFTAKAPTCLIATAKCGMFRPNRSLKGSGRRLDYHCKRNSFQLPHCLCNWQTYLVHARSLTGSALTKL
jgi:REP element-mobilizing transposase RayT